MMSTEKTKSSLKYEDIISESVLIHSGSPAVYHLTPKKENIQNTTNKDDTRTITRRMTLGEKKLNKINKTILLVGETGTGKSTLINTLVNHTMGVEWEDNVWFQIIEEEKDEKDEKNDKSESQTSDVIVYEIFGFEDKNRLRLRLRLLFIDPFGMTPARKLNFQQLTKQCRKIKRYKKIQYKINNKLFARYRK